MGFGDAPTPLGQALGLPVQCLGDRSSLDGVQARSPPFKSSSARVRFTASPFPSTQPALPRTMGDQRQNSDRSDPADLEKELESRTSNVDSPSGGFRKEESDSKILLSEDQVLNRARELPDSSEPVYLTFSVDDKDVPRNWPKWKKWYITCFVSMLNVLTCVLQALQTSMTIIETDEFNTAAFAQAGTVPVKSSS